MPLTNAEVRRRVVMPRFLEARLKKEYPGNNHAVYGTMNKIGAMKGSKETPLGREMDRKHAAKMGKKAKRK